MKRSILILFIILFDFFTFSGCSKEDINKIPANKLNLKVAIFRTGGIGPTYLFNLKPNGNLEVTFGGRNEIWNGESYTGRVNGEKHLAEEQQYNLVNLANEVYKKEPLPIKENELDSLEVFVNINDKTYNFYYHIDQLDQAMGKLVNELIGLSPIEVDLRKL